MTDSSKPTYVYIARCCDGSFYTGVSADVTRRIEQHNRGRGAKYTQQRRPIELVYSEICDSLGAALKREHQIKTWKRDRKEALVLTSRKSSRKRKAPNRKSSTPAERSK